MKLNYLVTPGDLGGTAVPSCGTIHKSEIKETLNKLSDDLLSPFDFNDYMLGSTGKREYSGDIDLVVDPGWGLTLPTFRELLESTFPKEDIARNGNMLHLKYPIVGYNAKFNDALPRTGFVQIDFNFGDAKWEKVYHYSNGSSAYKGAHRNLMISAICAATEEIVPQKFTDFDTIVEYWDAYNRPVSVIRWKYGPNGFTKVHRKSQKDRNGIWMRKQNDTILEGPIKDENVIRNILFPVSSLPTDLDSLETLMDAVKRNYGMTDQERVWKRSASNFTDWNQGKLFKYPSEIAKYIPTDDK